jgi:hypothetical protein
MGTGIAHKNGPKKYWWAIGYISGRPDKCCINFSEFDYHGKILSVQLSRYLGLK